ncbi:MAG TPA: hypothetical protein VGR16_07485 [Thermomicrobiales bacterium]|nr:hypothetical protein [Thermomicrobiales bacterium]
MAEAVNVAGAVDLKALAEEVHATGESRILELDGEKLAVLAPLPADDEQVVYDEGSDWEVTDEDRKATLSAFGGWVGLVDAEELKARIKAARGSHHPPVKL